MRIARSEFGPCVTNADDRSAIKEILRKALVLQPASVDKPGSIFLAKPFSAPVLWHAFQIWLVNIWNNKESVLPPLRPSHPLLARKDRKVVFAQNWLGTYSAWKKGVGIRHLGYFGCGSAGGTFERLKDLFLKRKSNEPLKNRTRKFISNCWMVMLINLTYVWHVPLGCTDSNK